MAHVWKAENQGESYVVPLLLIIILTVNNTDVQMCKICKITEILTGK